MLRESLRKTEAEVVVPMVSEVQVPGGDDKKVREEREDRIVPTLILIIIKGRKVMNTF